MSFLASLASLAASSVVKPGFPPVDVVDTKWPLTLPGTNLLFSSVITTLSLSPTVFRLPAFDARPGDARCTFVPNKHKQGLRATYDGETPANGDAG